MKVSAPNHAVTPDLIERYVWNRFGYGNDEARIIGPQVTRRRDVNTTLRCMLNSKG